MRGETMWTRGFVAHSLVISKLQGSLIWEVSKSAFYSINTHTFILVPSSLTIATVVYLGLAGTEILLTDYVRFSKSLEHN